MLTWRLVLGVATGVHQNVGLKGGVKVVVCTEEGGTKWGYAGKGAAGGVLYLL